MSHGGMGGGHGHSGFGHHGGHSGFGHGIAHGHHGGNLVHKVLHALGLGHHGHHHGGAMHHPDQAPNWNQAMQGPQDGWSSMLKVNQKPLVVFALLIAVSFFWLWLVYTLGHSEPSTSKSEAPAVPPPAPIGSTLPLNHATPALPGQAMYGSQSYGQPMASGFGQAPAQQGFGQAPVQQYANQYSAAADAAMRDAAANPFGMPQGAMQPSAAPMSAVPPATAGGGTYGQPQQFGYAPSNMSPPVYNNAYAAGPQPRYAPLSNGRARLVVNR